MSDAGKRAAAEQAAALVEDGMRLGLGTGSTVDLLLPLLAARGLRDLRCVATSERTERSARELGLPVEPFDSLTRLDLAIDGADEVDPDLATIKGGGGALLRERIVLAAAAERMIIVDASKVVPVLGSRWAVPVEVVRFGWRVAERALVALGAAPTLRREAEQPFITDEGNYILDCRFGEIPDPRGLAQRISGLPGVMAHGIFVDFADRVLVAGEHGVETRLRAKV